MSTENNDREEKITETENKNAQPQTRTLPRSLRDYRGIFWLCVALLAVVGLFFFFPNIAETINKYLSSLTAVIIGIVMAYILNPIVIFFKSKFIEIFTSKGKFQKNRDKVAQRLAVTVTVICLLLVLALLILLIVPNVLSSVIKLAEKIPDYADKVTEKLRDWNEDRSWAGRFAKYIDTILDRLEDYFTNTIAPFATDAVKGLTSAAWSAVMFILDFIIGIVIAVYALKEKKRILSWSKKLTFAIFKPETANIILDSARHSNKIFQGFLIGSLLDCAMVTIICFLFNIIAGIPYSLLIAVIVGITNIIPFFGPFIGAAPSIILIMITSPVKAVIFAIFMVIMNQIEGNILVPRVLGMTTGVSEFWVAFSLLFFGAMFGVIGMIVGVPITAVISYTIANLIDRHMEKKKMVVDTDYYLNVEKFDTEKGEFVKHDSETVPERVKPEEIKPKYQFSDKLWKKFTAWFKKNFIGKKK